MCKCKFPKNRMCSSRKYPYSPHGRFFVLHPPSPSRNSSFGFLEPLPLGISNNLPWGGDGFFLELHNAIPGCMNPCFLNSLPGVFTVPLVRMTDLLSRLIIYLVIILHYLVIIHLSCYHSTQ